MAALTSCENDLLVVNYLTAWSNGINGYISQLFLEPELALSQLPMSPKTERAINLEAMRARGIIVLVKSN